MGVGPLLMSMQTTLVVHAIAAPVFFFIISFIYHAKFNYTKPLVTALIFVGFVIFMDFMVVALIIERNFEMFASPLGTWIPFVLIFFATCGAGRFAQTRQ